MGWMAWHGTQYGTARSGQTDKNEILSGIGIRRSKRQSYISIWDRIWAHQARLGTYILLSIRCDEFGVWFGDYAMLARLRDCILQPYMMEYGDFGSNGCYGVRDELESLPLRHAGYAQICRYVPCHVICHAMSCLNAHLPDNLRSMMFNGRNG